MSLELAFNIGIGLISALLGWIVRIVYDAQQKLTKDIQDIEVRMNEDFVRKDDLRYLLEQIFSRFDRLESRLEHFFNQKGH